MKSEKGRGNNCIVNFNTVLGTFLTSNNRRGSHTIEHHMTA